MKWKRIAAGILAAALIINDVPLYANAQENINVTSEETGQGSDFDTGNTDIEQPPAETEDGTETPAEDAPETEPATEPTEEPTVTEEPAAEEPAPTEETQEAEITPEAEAAPMAEGGYEYTLDDFNSDWAENGINIQTSQDMCKLSHVNPKAYQNEKIILSSTSATYDLTKVDKTEPVVYQGLGTAEFPFRGTFMPGAAVGITLNTALFQGLSNQATQGNNNAINLTWKGSTSAVWAENYVVDGVPTEGDSSWTFQIINNFEDPTYNSFASLIGTMSVLRNETAGTGLKLNTNLATVEKQFKAQISGDENVSMGVFCREMQAGAVLDISGSTLPTGYSVKASGNASAGGLVGTMGAGAKLICNPTTGETVSLTNADTTITASGTGSAGALIGAATDAIFDFGNAAAVSIAGGTISGGSNVGGLIGNYMHTGSVPDSISTLGSVYRIEGVTLTPAAGGNAGGVFGSLAVTGTAFSLRNAESGSPAVSSTLGGTAANYGGLIGAYSAGQLADTLNLNGTTSLNVNAAATATIMSDASSQTITGSYGGAIASVASNSYVSIENMAEGTVQAASVPNFGGLLGSVGDGCTIEMNGVSVNGTYSTGVTVAGGGLIGTIGQGSSLRLDGITRLESGTTGSGNVKYGQLVGMQNSSLIYAMPGWADKYVRNNGQIVDDIGNYGQVVRLDTTKITVGNMLLIDEVAHTVALSSGPSYAADITLSSSSDFAKLALTVQSRGYFSGDSGINSGNYSSNNIMSKSIKLTADIDMRSTGIQGLTRDIDDGTYDTYKATFDGENHTLTLSVGEVYGVNNDEKQGAMVAHDKLGLFAGLQNNATVKNLKLSGSMNICNLTSALCAGGIAGLGNSGSINLDNVDTNLSITNLDGGTQAAKVGGLIGRINASGTISITNCDDNVTIKNTGTTDFACANMIGYIQANGMTTVTMTTNTISGSITDTKATTNPWAGGVIGYLEGKNNATLNICSLTVGDGNTANSSDKLFTMNVTKGGLLGYRWDLADVTLQDVKVNNAELTTSGDFGGLLYEASGRITISKDATSTPSTSGVAITNSTFTGNSTGTGTTDALLVCMGKALYLNVDQNAYTIGNNNDGEGVTITKNNQCFDELVGQSIDKDTSNGILSYNLMNNTTGKIDQTNCDTYQNKTVNASGGAEWLSSESGKEARTRYYYNLPTILANQNISDGGVNMTEELMLWSILHYAAPAIQKYFGVQATAGVYTISDNIDLTGYSYYPVCSSDTNINGATITFDNLSIETQEKENKKTSEKTSQHYGMQCGLFLNVTSANMTVQNLTLSGNVGRWKDGSGALISGYFSSGQSQIAESGGVVGQEAITNRMMLNAISLKDLWVVDADESSPLLINKIATNQMGKNKETGFCQINITNVRTDAKDQEKGYAFQTGKTIAASSLIGSVGTETAQSLTIAFTKMVLDGRKEVDVLLSSYKTKKSIFSSATFMQSFQYASSSNGSYTFNLAEDWSADQTHIQDVTYGMEISSSVRNANTQKQYYDQEIYVDDTNYPTKDDNKRNFDQKYLPYVYKTKANSLANVASSNISYNEIDVNLKKADLEKGCGCYTDPYKISVSGQLRSLEQALNGTPPSDWIVNVNTAPSSETGCNGNTHVAYQYVASAGEWQGYNLTAETVDPTKRLSKADMVKYLSSAYYLIETDITLPAGFSGLGGTDCFQGVIVGKEQNDGTYPTITIPAGDTPTTVFGGLILNSAGSVVRNLNIELKNTTEQLTSSLGFILQSNQANDRYFGGVIGCIKNGDNIIDNVSVDFSLATFKFQKDSSYSHNMAVGGYVGLIKQGGVVFRNQDEQFANDGEIKVTDGLTLYSSKTEASDAAMANNYYYLNPYIGCLWDGYAVRESLTDSDVITLKNTDKNYSIINVNPQKDVNSFEYSSNKITLNSEKGLYLFSSLVASASLAGNDAIAKDPLWGRYTIGRTASYAAVGAQPSQEGNADLGNANNDYYIYVDQSASKMVSSSKNTRYLLQYGSGLIIPESGDMDQLKNITTLEFKEGMSFDLRAYKNGFRGIGARTSMLAEKNVLNRLVKITGYNSVIQYEMNVREYASDSDDTKATGVGLFPRAYTKNANSSTTISSLSISNTIVTLKQADASGVVQKNDYSTNSVGVGVGALIGYNATNTVDKTKTRRYNIKECILQNVKVQGSDYAGGFIGYSRESVAFTACKYEKTNKDNSFGVHVTGRKSAGGFIGYIGIIDSVLNIQGKSETEPTIISGGTIEVLAPDAKLGVGGLVGSTGDKAVDFTVENIIMDGVEVKSNTTVDIGGIGGVIGRNHTASTGKLGNVMIKNSQIEGYSSQVGGLIGYIANGTKLKAIKCMIGGSGDTSKVTVRALSTQGRAGGILGTTGYAGDILIEQSIVQNTELIGGFSVGGLIADQAGGRTVTVRDVKVQNNQIVVNGPGGCGGLVGRLNSAKIYGSNVLLCDNTIKHSTNASESSVGLLAGTTGKIQLAGVSRQVTGANTLPAKEVGGSSGYIGYIVYADYTGAATTDGAYKVGANAPYVTVNPKSTVTVYETAESATGTVVTGDASAMTTDNMTSVAQKILDDYNRNTVTRYAEAKSFADLNLTTADMLTSYNTVQGTKLSDDFPVLQISTNDRTEATEQIAAYLDMVTNGGYTKARVANTTSSYHASAIASTYQYTNGRFVKQTDSSISVLDNNTSDLSYRINPGKYDNTKNQFTLLDVTFGNNTTGQFVLRIPIIVKQVVTIETSAVTQNDSPFYNMSYEARKTSANHILLGSGQTFTTQLTYTYSNYDWTEAVNGGGNLRWNYDKRIDFDNGPLLKGTVLTLVDPNQNGKHYSYTVEADKIESINLSDFKDCNGAGFSPIKLDQLIEFTAEEDVAGTLVECDEANATVAALLNGVTTYFRPKNDTDVAETTKLYKVSTSTSETKFQEQYYLVADTAEDASTVINGKIVLCNTAKNNLSTVENGLPYDLSQVQNDVNRNENVYLINTKFVQTLTSDVINWQPKEVKKGEGQSLELTDTIQINQSLRNYIENGKDTIFQQFSFEFNDGKTDVAIPNGTEYQVVFTLYDRDTQIENGKIYQVSGTVATPQSTLNVTFPGDLASIITSLSNNGSDSVLKLKAAVTFTFPTENAMSIFPAYSSAKTLTNTTDFTDGHIQINTTSRMSYSENTLTSGEKNTLTGNTWYYQTKDAKATLDYNGDELNQLGINIRDLYTADAVSIINTTGVYNLSTLADLDNILEQTQTLECKLTFEQKDNTGSYQEVADPQQYLDGIYAGKGGTATTIDNLTGSTYTWNLTNDGFGTYYDSSTKCFTLPFEVRVKNDIETTSGTYANFKITLTVTPKASDGKKVLNEEQDFIIYTFAKVPTTIVR